MYTGQSVETQTGALIRFGKWEDSRTFKTNSDPSRRIFPIPATELNINPNLAQNEEY